MNDPRETIDPDGNVIREGMTIVCQGEVWTVSLICSDNGHCTMIVADRVLKGGMKCRLIVGRKRLRLIHVIGFQSPRITYP
jgi:hypothetical protein